MQRLDSLLLASVGVLITHQVAYTAISLLGTESPVTHGHMALAWYAGSLTALVCLARSVVHSLRQRRHRVVNELSTIYSIAGGYAALELIERVLNGYSPLTLFGEPVFWLGIAAAPLVATVLRRSLTIAADIALIISLPRPEQRSEHGVKPAVGASTPVPPLTLQLSSVVSRRGPPIDFQDYDPRNRARIF